MDDDIPAPPAPTRGTDPSARARAGRRRRSPRPVAPVGAVAVVAAAAAAAAALPVGAGTARGTSNEPVTLILDELVVSGSQVHTQQSPIAVHGDAVYVANIEPGPRGDVDGLDLVTVVRRGTPGASASDPAWTWTDTVIDERTAFDEWHSAPGIGVDERGFVHVAWNMHNLPWQYGVSAAPDSIERFEYRGQAITDAELRRYKFENKTRFPAPGSAAIPGNQITYPAFHNDRDGRLWVTYRFAAKPHRAFEQRMMSSGVARYDADSRRWTAVGGPIEHAPGDFEGPAEDAERLRAVAGADGWTSYLPRLTFGEGGRMNVSTLWREGIAGADMTRPCLVVTDDGRRFRTIDGDAVPLPAAPDDCGAMDAGDTTYHSISSAAADAGGAPHVVLSPADGGRVLFSFDGGRWRSEPTPWAASEVFFDARDNAWAVATGPHLFVRPKGEAEWRDVWSAEGGDGCRPRVALDGSRQVAYVYTMGCEENLVSVHRAELERLLPGS